MSRLRQLILLCGTVGVLVLGALITELTIRRVDTGPLITYMATLIVPLVPIFNMLFKQEKTLPAIQEVASQAAEHAANAAEVAAQVEHNTNGAMTAKFDTVTSCIRELSGKFDAHIAEHAKEVAK